MVARILARQPLVQVVVISAQIVQTIIRPEHRIIILQRRPHFVLVLHRTVFVLAHAVRNRNLRKIWQQPAYVLPHLAVRHELPALARRKMELSLALVQNAVDDHLAVLVVIVQALFGGLCVRLQHHRLFRNAWHHLIHIQPQLLPNLVQSFLGQAHVFHVKPQDRLVGDGFLDGVHVQARSV